MPVPAIGFLLPTEGEVDAKVAAAEARFVEALDQLVTQQMLAAALANLAAMSDVSAAVEPFATKAAVEAAKAAAIRDATAGRPNWTETNKRVQEPLAPILTRLAALEAKAK